jgi:hypothetical protein
MTFMLGELTMCRITYQAPTYYSTFQVSCLHFQLTTSRVDPAVATRMPYPKGSNLV